MIIRSRRIKSNKGRRFSVRPVTLRINTWMPFHRTKYSIYLSSIICTGLVFILSYTCMFKPIKSRLVKRTNQKISNRRRIRQQNDRAIFKFIMDSGKQRLASSRYRDALSEFRLALKIYPTNKDARSFLLYTLNLLCQEETSYCYELTQLEFQ